MGVGIYMVIKTESIKCLLEDTFNKSSDDIKISDILLVQSLTIDSLNYDNKKVPLFLEEIKLFKNLRYLEVCNVCVDNEFINMLLYLPFVENVIFRNCDFSSKLSVIDSDIKLKRIMIDSCCGFKFAYFNNLTTLKSITVKNSNFSSFNGLRKIRLNYLEIIGNCFITRFSLSYLNVDKFVVSSNIYSKYKKMFAKVSSSVIVYSDDGFYIKKHFKNGRCVGLI